MSSEPNSKLSFKCPRCKHPLRVSKSASGKQVTCLACREKITVPAEEIAPGDADRWLQLEDAPSPEPKGAVEKSSPPKLGASSFDDDLPELAPLSPPSPLAPIPGIGTALDDALARLAQDEADRGDQQPRTQDEEFSFPCKVCGTLLYTSVSRVGSMTRCPDCHSEFSVPSRPAKKKSLQYEVDTGLADVRLAPVNEGKPRAETMETRNTKEILDRAAIEADRERQELDITVPPFDSQRWLSLVFGCFRDPGVIFIASILGGFAAACCYGLYEIGKIEMSIVQVWILRAILFAVVGVPILISIVMCFMVILPMAANRLKRVEDWPFGRFGESIGEIAMLVTAIAIAAFPGACISTMLSWVDAHPVVREVVVLLSIWGFTPIMLLSMIENNQILNPFSKVIFDSIRMRSEGWGAMYFQTGILIAGLFVLYSIAYITNAGMMAFFGFVFPFCMFLIANQYGVLAGRLSEITNLGFEGDFSQDNET